MDKNTFWSHTAPSYELIHEAYSQSEDNVEDTKTTWVKCKVIHTRAYLIYDSDSDENDLIEVRTFGAANANHDKNNKEKLFHWKNK